MGESQKPCPFCGRQPGEAHKEGCTRENMRHKSLGISSKAFLRGVQTARLNKNNATRQERAEWKKRQSLRSSSSEVSSS